jgi:23S rRNA pseudouridine1911/1915/1917 synthase
MMCYLESKRQSACVTMSELAENSLRLDQYVVTQMPVSRAFAAKLIERGDVLVNKEPITKTGYRVKSADKVRINYDEAQANRHEKIELEVLYEDDDCLVINKPAGVLTHSKGAFNPEGTVATWLADRTGMPGSDRAGIVHRLDRATSGVMILAKTAKALSWLQKQFSQRKVKKTYIAVVRGSLREPEAIIDMPIERNPKKPQTFRVGSNGRSAITAYKVLDTGNSRSLLELKPTTGRTHQLRVHLQELGHSIVGDTLYGGSAADRLYLHAKALEITLPNKQRETFTVPVPKVFKGLVSNG